MTNAMAGSGTEAEMVGAYSETVGDRRVIR